MKISKFNRGINRRLRLNLQCNRLRLHAIFRQFNRLRLLKKTVTDYDYPMSEPKMVVSRLTSSKYCDIDENHLNWTHLQQTRTRWSNAKELMYLQWCL